MPTTREPFVRMVRPMAWDGWIAIRPAAFSPESKEYDMSLDHTAAGLCWSNAGILVMEDGLIYRRAVAGRGWRSNLGAAGPAPSRASVVLWTLAAFAVTSLLIASPAETAAAMAGF